MGLRWLLRRLGICPNAYYNYLKNRKAKYRQNKAKLLAIITEIYHERNGIPGYRLMTALLKNKGVSLSGTTCHKYMNVEALPDRIAGRWVRECIQCSSEFLPL